MKKKTVKKAAPKKAAPKKALKKPIKKEERPSVDEIISKIRVGLKSKSYVLIFGYANENDDSYSGGVSVKNMQTFDVLQLTAKLLGDVVK